MGGIIEEMGHLMHHVEPHLAFKIGPVEVTSTVVTTWIVMLVLFVGVWLLTRGLSVKPGGSIRQHIVELVIVGFILDLMEGQLGRDGRRFLPLIGTLFIFILCLNMAWLIPAFKPPTMDLNTTAALAVTTMIIIWLAAIKEHGPGNFVKHYTEPLPFLMPLNIIEELVRPFSLALRLFGNVFGEELIIGMLVIISPLFLPIPLQLFEILMFTIQALVFTILPIAYIEDLIYGH